MESIEEQTELETEKQSVFFKGKKLSNPAGDNHYTTGKKLHAFVVFCLVFNVDQRHSKTLV
jgi:hypothetical protein